MGSQRVRQHWSDLACMHTSGEWEETGWRRWWASLKTLVQKWPSTNFSLAHVLLERCKWDWEHISRLDSSSLPSHSYTKSMDYNGPNINHNQIHNFRGLWNLLPSTTTNPATEDVSSPTLTTLPPTYCGPLPLRWVTTNLTLLRVKRIWLDLINV